MNVLSANQAALARKEANSALLRREIAERRTIFEAWPEVVGLHTTDICDLRCVMCPRHDKQGTRKLSRERLRAACEELFPAAKKVALSGAAGEPLLADFDLALELALRHAVRIDIVTNGNPLTPELWREASPALDHVNVSMDTHVPELYHRIRVGGHFDRVDGHLRAIREIRRREPSGVLLSVSAVVLRSTLEHMSDFVRWARELEVDAVVLYPLNQYVRRTPGEDPLEDPGPEGVRAALMRVQETARAVGQNLFVGDFGLENVLPVPLRDKVPPDLVGAGVCSYVVQHLGIQPTGEVYPCCFPTDFRLGNLHFQSAREIWNSEVAQRLRASHFERRRTLFCSGCSHAPYLPPPAPAWQEAPQKLIRRAAMHATSRVATWITDRRQDHSTSDG